LGDLKDIVKEINVMIGEQGQDISKVEKTTTQASQAVQTGVKEQKKVRLLTLHPKLTLSHSFIDLLLRHLTLYVD
jgi:methyl-accepting chemotaxis protein